MSPAKSCLRQQHSSRARAAFACAADECRSVAAKTRSGCHEAMRPVRTGESLRRDMICDRFMWPTAPRATLQRRSGYPRWQGFALARGRENYDFCWSNRRCLSSADLAANFRDLRYSTESSRDFFASCHANASPNYVAVLISNVSVSAVSRLAVDRDSRASRHFACVRTWLPQRVGPAHRSRNTTRCAIVATCRTYAATFVGRCCRRFCMLQHAGRCCPARSTYCQSHGVHLL